MIRSVRAQLREIAVHNTHPECRIRKREIEDIINRMLISEGVDSSVAVIFVDDDFMRKINRKFAKRRKTTDVLSFGMNEGENMAVDYPSLGDIYVSLDQAKRQAKDYRVSLRAEARRLVIHGLLHLLGYDHKRKTEAKIMKEKEEAYLNWSASSKA
jgi:probable rRNA maturation factor